ncbi:terpene synthase family protein [Pseudonocardia sp. ICBG1142]|uniref:terpene synthase family protein n=1 Tax=Pseudonocardia sp. ICBG1142 TaxID=2846760 RepID=UPI001CF6D4A6|nr:terpene synthase family protein [Pseudonocardia sp. ICBG1142]
MLTIIDDVGDAVDQGGVREAASLRRAILSAIDDLTQFQMAAPAPTAFHDLWRRTAPLQSPGWRQRARADLALYLHQFAVQRQNREEGRRLTVSDYVQLRRNSVGLDVNADILEAIHRISIPDPLFASGLVRELRNCFVDANAWFNDYYSFEREVTEGERHNLALVLADQDGIKFDESLERVLEMASERLRRFLFLERKIPDTVHGLGYGEDIASETLRYAQTLRDYTYGHVAWSSTSSRYDKRRLRATKWS